MENKNGPETSRPRLSKDRKEHLFGCLLRVPGMLLRAKDLLRPEEMDNPEDTPLLILWQAARAIAARNNGTLPTMPEQARVQLELEAKMLIERDPISTTKADFEALFGSADEPHSGLFEYYYTQPPEVFSEEEGARLLKQYLEETTLYKEVERAARRWQGDLPASVDAFLSKIQAKRAAIAGLDQRAVMDVIPAGYQHQKVETFSTGVSFLDEFMGGGQSPGEVYVILGPTGGGKTTLGVQIAVEGALLEQNRKDKTAGNWYYLTYESAVDPDIRNRVMAYSGQISEKSIRDNNFSSEAAKDWKGYEREIWKIKTAPNRSMPGERERWHAIAKKLGQSNLRLVDYMGTFPGSGEGGIDEIAAMLEYEHSAGRRIAGLVIDYAGIAVLRHLNARNLDPKLEYTKLKDYVNEMRIKVASRFNCCAWVLHQLKGELAARGPGAVFHHSDAHNCRNFADNAWFAFCLGNLDKENRTVTLNCSKTRRGDARPHAIIRLEPEIRRFTATNGDYALDEHQRRTVPTTYINKIMSRGAGAAHDRVTDN